MGAVRAGNDLDQPLRRLEAVLQNATASVFLMNDRQHCIYMNPAAEQLTGFTLDEVLAADQPLHDIIHHLHPDGTPFPMHDCAIDRAFPDHAKTQGEEVFVHKDGSFYPVAFTASPIHDDTSSTIGTIIEVRNIAAEKQREQDLRRAIEEKKVLLQEVNHRVKNSLQLVASLLALQEQSTVSPELKQSLQEASSRVGVIASLHNRLYQTQDYDSVDVCEYLLELGREAMISAAKDGVRFHFSGDARRKLPISDAVSLALIVSELILNAVKHAFREGNGTLELRICETDDCLTIEVIDDGCGLPAGFAMTKSKTLGMKIIRALSRQLRADVSFRNAEPGTAWRIAVPTSR